jgi:histidinol-phosphate aminotransferase
VIDLIVRAFVAPNENVVYPVPSFIVYGLVAKVCGCRGVGVPCRDYRLDLAAMRAAVDANTRVVFVCNPNNPTSTYLTASEVAPFDSLPGRRARRDELSVHRCVDAPTPNSLSLLSGRDNVVVLAVLCFRHRRRARGLCASRSSSTRSTRRAFP